MQDASPAGGGHRAIRRACGSRQRFRTLPLEVSEGDCLVFIGCADNALGETSLKEARDSLQPQQRPNPSFVARLPAKPPLTWVEPGRKRVFQFTARMELNMECQVVLMGSRHDTDPSTVRRDTVVSAEQPVTANEHSARDQGTTVEAGGRQGQVTSLDEHGE